MEEAKKIVTPLSEDAVWRLRAGDRVLISGKIYSARDIAHKRLCAAIDAGEELPFELSGSVVYFVGPTPARQGAVIGAAGPTTSSRMDGFSPKLLESGLKGMIGKGYRGDCVRKALKKYCAVHFATIGGAGALLSRHIVSSKVIAYDDLGPEAVRQMEVEDFPAVVAYDCYGGSVYDKEKKQ
ncbi:MAG: Fe-S-containing hydro-lyase [Planctomycetes bacterium]|nr:Fe-S-containing hydro-lyase [Planctomycetota bacterium]